MTSQCIMLLSFPISNLFCNSSQSAADNTAVVASYITHPTSPVLSLPSSAGPTCPFIHTPTTNRSYTFPSHYLGAASHSPHFSQCGGAPYTTFKALHVSCTSATPSRCSTIYSVFSVSCLPRSTCFSLGNGRAPKFDGDDTNLEAWFATAENLAVKQSKLSDDAVIINNTISLTDWVSRVSLPSFSTRLQRSATAPPGLYYSNFSEMTVRRHCMMTCMR